MDDNGIIGETLENSNSQEHDAQFGSLAKPPSPLPGSDPTKATTNNNKRKTKKPAIRHAEKRRTSTCQFADRVAQLSVDHYKATIPIEKRPPQTCIATIIAHYRKKEDGPGDLWVLSMGVGTKFLSESCLRQELENEQEEGYGSRVRDMHAEVLARRAFRRQLTLEIQEDLRAIEEKEQAEQRSKPSKTTTFPSDCSSDDGTNQLGEKLSILVRSLERPENDGDPTIRYMLRPGVTLHMYTSSAPCGNATLKKFCKMSKERFRDDLGPDEWPDAPHEPPPGHSIKLGEFSLLLKKDNDNQSSKQTNSTDRNDIIQQNSSSSIGGERGNGNKSTNTVAVRQTPSTIDRDNMVLVNTKKRTRNEEGRLQSQDTKTQDPLPLKPHKLYARRGKPWPATLSDDWAPPGTTIVGFQQKGSIHTCSDKICRWNYLGLQGSLLAGILNEPLYLSTLTVGRKLSGAVCRRAICCRLDTRCRQPRLPMPQQNLPDSSNDDRNIVENKYRVNHPAVMGTSVYLDMGVVDTSNIDERGQDVRFHSSFVWCWWRGPPTNRNNDKDCMKDCEDGVLECIESASGLLVQLDENQCNQNAHTRQDRSVASNVSTEKLISLFLQVYHHVATTGKPENTKGDIDSVDKITREQANPHLRFNNTLDGIHQIKKQCSPVHETFKDLLLKEHKVLSQWRRRYDSYKCNYCDISSFKN